VLTATSLSYGESKNSTPHRIKTPDPIKIKFGTVDYVGEGTRHAKFYASIPQKLGGFYWVNHQETTSHLIQSKFLVPLTCFIVVEFFFKLSVLDFADFWILI